MGEALRRFIPRAPRYVLRPSDNQMLRFAPNRVLNRSYSTRFINVSETGLAFVVDRSSAPGIGDFIKIEFPIPGAKNQIAWFAKVVRLEEFSATPWWSERAGHDNDVLVGVQFHQLPDGHRLAIRLHLQTMFREAMRERQTARWRRLRGFIAEHGPQIVMYAIATVLTVAILYFISRPAPNYDEHRGAPWGQRFKF
jgi:hypothetical protein